MNFRIPLVLITLLAIASPAGARSRGECDKTHATAHSDKPCASLPPPVDGSARSNVGDLWNGAGIATARSDFPLAETALRQAIASLLGPDGTANAGEENALYLDLAMVIAAQGRLAEAKVLLARVSPLVEAAGNASEQARLAGYRSQLADLEGNRSEARAFAADAVKRWREIAEPTEGAAPPGSVAELAMALNAEARLLLRDREITTATIEASEALLLLDMMADAPKWWRGEILATLGETSMSVGRAAAAETYFKAAITHRRSLFGEGAETVRMRLALGRAFTREGLYTAAIVTYREAFAALRQVGYNNIRLRADQLVPMALAVSEYASRIEDPAARQGAYAEAHEAFQLASDPAGERFVLSSTERMRAASPQLAAALRQIDDAELEYWRRRSELSRLQALPQIDRKIDLERSAGQAMTDQQARLDDLSRELAADFPDYRRLTDRRPPTLDALRSRLQPGEAIATFLIGSEGSFVEIVRRDGIAIAPVPLTRAELAASVARLRRGLEIAGGTSGDFDLAEAHRLYRALFGGVEGSLSDVSRLLLVPSAALGSLPLGILVREEPKNNHPASAHWLIRDMSVIRVPSTASFIALRSTRPVNPPAKQILAVADPVFARPMDTPSSPSVMPTSADPCAQSGLSRELAHLPALPETAAEATAVVRMLAGADEDLLLGRSATLAGLNGRGPSDYRVLYFATHAVMPGELRCASDGGLALTADANSASGLLTPADIATLPLQAELVVLSACNTGSTGPGDDSSLSGLAGAFLHAGARSLLITHWQVPSRATGNLMIDLFSRLQHAKGGEAATVDQALRAAQLKLISDPATAPPTFWGAFELLGAGTAADFQGSGA